MGTGTIRIGGLCAIASAAAIVPAYLAGSPDQPDAPGGVQSYVEGTASFVTANGVLPLLHILFGMLFLGVLTATLRTAAGPTGAVYTALIGGTVFLALTAAGLAAEVAVPAALMQFDDVTATGASQPVLGLSMWLYHYSQLGAGAMIFATAYVIWRTGVLPKWSAALAVLGVPALLHTWVGLPGAYSTAAWFALTGLLMLALPPVVRMESVGV
ncbi:hypothetical protein [Mycolicibacterium pulveris]|uniref:hypothetical protein n=1 Tax=Mycolicibacterium pulveris TaxID=36813 RepID=UPI003CF5928F